MPQTRAQGSNLLNIKLDDNRGYFTPGDTIIGYASRGTLTVQSHCRVKIALLGRTKSRMVVSRGNSSSTYRGRFNLMDERQTTKVIFDGPIHIPKAQSMRFPFALTIPKYVDPKQVRMGEPQKDNFLATDPQSVAGHVLPSTFEGGYHGFSTNMDAFVEYWLKATITAGSSTHEATLPVTIRALSDEPPIVNFKLKKYSIIRSLISQRLMPGMETADLTFSQKTRKFFASSKLPNFRFMFQAGIPQVIQMESGQPIPFRLRISPDWNHTSEELQDIPQKVKLLSVNLQIRSITRIICEGTFGNHDEDKETKIELGIEGAVRSLGDIYIPCSSNESGIDIGELINLRIGYNGRIHENRRPGVVVMHQKLYPSFKTYNIAHTHTIKWTVKYQLAMEVLESSSEQMITILPPSDSRPQMREDGPSTAAPPTDSWIVPPADDEAPPSFQEVQQQDRENASKAAEAASVGDDKARLQKKDEEEEEEEEMGNSENVAGPSTS